MEAEKKEQRVAEIILVQVAVPASGGIRAGEMAQAVRCAVPVMPVGAGMDMNSGAIPGDGQSCIPKWVLDKLKIEDGSNERK